MEYQARYWLGDDDGQTFARPEWHAERKFLFTPTPDCFLTKGEEYTDQGQDYYEERYRQRVLRHLAQRAEKMGMKLVTSE